MQNDLNLNDFFKNIFFIVFEGVDGCGKTTLIKILSDYIKKNTNYELLPLYQEKADSLIQEKIFNNPTTPSKELQLLYWWTTRRKLLEDVSLNNDDINNKKILIADRYYDSTFVYQDLNGPISSFNYSSDLFPTPNLTFYLQVDFDTAYSRINSRYNEQNFDPYNDLKQYIDRYNLLFCSGCKIDRPYDTDHCIEVVDATLSLFEVSNIVISQFKNHYKSI